jgi:hypothetical protein
MKKLIAILLCYLAATSVLASALLGGVFWLIRTDPTESAPARVAAIPPRIADSIERRKMVLPAPEPQVPPAPVRPMQEANVALKQPPPAARWVIRELTPSRPNGRRARSLGQPPVRASAEAIAPAYAVTTGRDENPSGL